MGSVTYGGFYDDSDPIYQEGFTIVAPKMSTNEDSKNNGSKKDQKLLEYLPESSREHEVIGKWLSQIQEREKKPFESFSDIENRTGLKEPIRHISKRILEEISGETRMNLFVKR